MRKLMGVLLLVLFLAGGARASVEEALEACRAENGLLPDEPGGTAYSADVLLCEMRLRMLRCEREKFDALLELMKKHFQSPLLLLYPRLDAKLAPERFENRVGNDLLACRLLLDASVLWNEPKYRDLALRMARRVLRFNVYRNALVSGASWKERKTGIFTLYGPRHEIGLSSIDVRALQQLSDLMPPWEAVAQRCLGILLAGSGGKEPRLVYDLDRSSYAAGSGSLVEQLRVMTHLLDGGFAPLRAVEQLAHSVDEDPYCLARGEHGSPAASILGGYVLGRAGRVAQSHKVFLSLDEEFGIGENLLHAAGQTPSIYDNLLYLIVKELLKADEAFL